MSRQMNWFTFGFLFSGLCLLVIMPRWDDVKGTCLVATSKFQITQGTIATSRLKYKSGGGKGKGGYQYDIHFVYSVAGKKYYSNNVSFSRTGGEREFLNSYLQRYPLNQSVTVYYQKNDPGFAVLEPDNKEPGLWIFLIGFIGAFASMLYGVYLTLVDYCQKKATKVINSEE